MSMSDKVRHKAQELRGRVKRNAAEVSGDPYMEGEGRAEERKANLKQAAAKIKDAFRGRRY
jgi:uncharacterized protein YjbJ (UPF0337 family)